MNRITIADHYPDDLPADLVLGATSRHAQYTVGDFRRALEPPKVTDSRVAATAEFMAHTFPSELPVGKLTLADVREIVRAVLAGPSSGDQKETPQ